MAHLRAAIFPPNDVRVGRFLRAADSARRAHEPIGNDANSDEADTRELHG